MSGQIESNPEGTSASPQITFKCNFCGESKPLDEMVVMRRYFPQLTACKACSKVTREPEQDPEE